MSVEERPTRPCGLDLCGHPAHTGFNGRHVCSLCSSFLRKESDPPRTFAHRQAILDELYEREVKRQAGCTILGCDNKEPRNILVDQPICHTCFSWMKTKNKTREEREEDLFRKKQEKEQNPDQCFFNFCDRAVKSRWEEVGLYVCRICREWLEEESGTLAERQIWLNSCQALIDERGPGCTVQGCTVLNIWKTYSAEPRCASCLEWIKDIEGRTEVPV